MNPTSKMKTGRFADKSLPAVILAAGEGHRMRDGDGRTPELLTRILGMTILERAIMSCREVGISEFFVVVGFHEEGMIRYISELGRRFGVSVWPLQTPNRAEGSGTSTLASSPYVHGSFLLLLCDHLFHPGIILSLMEAKSREKSCILAVDRRIVQITDLKDATKIRLDGEAITAIGKGISPFDAVHTGASLCGPDLFSGLKKARREGDSSLTGGVQRLIGNARIRAVDIGDRFWLSVDTPKSLSLAKYYLLAGVSRSSEDGFVSQHLNRPLSRRISLLLANTPLTPNVITVLNFLVSLCGAVLFSLGEYAWTILGGLLIQLGSILDGCDGEIARLRYQSGRLGAWLDTILDRYADVAVAVGISYGYWLTHPEPITWLGGILAITGFVLASYTKKEYELRYDHQPPGGMLNKLIKRDFRLFALFVGAVLNRPFEAMILVGFLSHVGILWIFISSYRLRERGLKR